MAAAAIAAASWFVSSIVSLHDTHALIDLTTVGVIVVVVVPDEPVLAPEDAELVEPLEALVPEDVLVGAVEVPVPEDGVLFEVVEVLVPEDAVLVGAVEVPVPEDGVLFEVVEVLVPEDAVLFEVVEVLVPEDAVLVGAVEALVPEDAVLVGDVAAVVPGEAVGDVPVEALTLPVVDEDESPEQAPSDTMDTAMAIAAATRFSVKSVSNSWHIPRRSRGMPTCLEGFYLQAGLFFADCFMRFNTIYVQWTYVAFHRRAHLRVVTQSSVRSGAAMSLV